MSCYSLEPLYRNARIEEAKCRDDEWLTSALLNKLGAKQAPWGNHGREEMELSIEDKLWTIWSHCVARRVLSLVRGTASPATTLLYIMKSTYVSKNPTVYYAHTSITSHKLYFS